MNHRNNKPLIYEARKRVGNGLIAFPLIPSKKR